MKLFYYSRKHKEMGVIQNWITMWMLKLIKIIMIEDEIMELRAYPYSVRQEL